MTPRYVVGVDGGTESIRAGVIDKDGKVLASASICYPTQHPQPGWAEQNPEDWWNGLGDAVRQAVSESGVPPAEIVALGLDTTCCSVVALDKTGCPLRPCLLWMDMRSAECANDVLATGDAALRVNSAGEGPVSAEWMIPKALWLKRTEPEIFAAAEYVCEYQASSSSSSGTRNIKLFTGTKGYMEPDELRELTMAIETEDFINFRLTGNMVASVNNASIRWHYSTVHGWPSSLLAKLGLSDLQAKWPQKVVALGDVVGGLTASAAAHLGLAEGLPVAQGGADAFVGMVGLGVSKSGELALLTGSSHLHLGLTDDRDLHGRGMWGSYSDAVLPGLGLVEGGQTSTGSAIKWFQRLLSGPEREDAVPYSMLNEEAEAVPIGCEGLVCLDHFQGNRTPFTDPLSRGAMAGLTLKHGRGHIFRALIEAVCLGTEAVFEAMRSAGYSPSSIAIAGGPTHSPLWLQIHADVSNVPLRLTRETEACMLGSAVLAAVGGGMFSDISSAIESMVHVERTVVPNADAHSKYKELLERYRLLYPALKPIFHQGHESSRDGVGNAEQQPGTTFIREAQQSAPSGGCAPDLGGVTGEVMGTVNASILAADMSDLGGEVKRALDAGADWIHIDVVDNQFAKVLTFGPPVVASVRRRHPSAFLDVHLAVENPHEYVDPLKTAGASQVLFHPEALRGHNMEEACTNLALQIKAAGMRVGVALKPETPISIIEHLLRPKQLVHCVDILAVQPGFGGQPFDSSVLLKVQELRATCPQLDIQVDGGINARIASKCVAAGANVLTAGSFIFRANAAEVEGQTSCQAEDTVAELRAALEARWAMRQRALNG